MRRPITQLFSLLVLGCALFGGAASAAPVGVNACQTIAIPGSYVLTSSINATAQVGDCIVVTADFVTLNLAGQAIIGAAYIGGVPSGDGIDVSGEGFVLRNGSIVGFQVGLNGSADGVTVESVRAVDNVTIGIQLSGGGHNVAKNVVLRSGMDGISTGAGTVQGNVARDNGGTGIIVACPAVVVANFADGNTTADITLSGGTCVDDQNSP